ncbi:WXG100 family type VII secretion target [Streptomyces sp. SYP-A7185]|uniref:WXG100 family type VII secretion target n=1 Tax=Streptomyces sp. SYP-A7185 TaxID=3040076 RepID=UPI0038F7E701
MADHGTTDYDLSVIDVSPGGMTSTSKQLADLALVVSERIGAINTTLGGLRVAWQGKAASDAEELSKEWTRVMTALFGTVENPLLGVLPTLADGLGMASGNFSVAEVGVTNLFKEFLANQSAEGDPGAAPEEITDTNRTAVTMTFPY